MLKNLFFVKIILLGLFSMPPLLCGMEGDNEVSQQLSHYMGEVAKNTDFSGAVLVAKGNQILLRRGYGYANMDHGIANTEKTVFRLASISKQFTAIAIQRYCKRGLSGS